MVYIGDTVVAAKRGNFDEKVEMSLKQIPKSIRVLSAPRWRRRLSGRSIPRITCLPYSYCRPEQEHGSLGVGQAAGSTPLHSTPLRSSTRLDVVAAAPFAESVGCCGYFRLHPRYFFLHLFHFYISFITHPARLFSTLFFLFRKSRRSFFFSSSSTSSPTPSHPPNDSHSQLPPELTIVPSLHISSITFSTLTSPSHFGSSSIRPLSPVSLSDPSGSLHFCHLSLCC